MDYQILKHQNPFCCWRHSRVAFPQSSRAQSPEAPGSNNFWWRSWDRNIPIVGAGQRSPSHSNPPKMNLSMVHGTDLRHFYSWWSGGCPRLQSSSLLHELILEQQGTCIWGETSCGVIVSDSVIREQQKASKSQKSDEICSNPKDVEVLDSIGISADPIVEAPESLEALQQRCELYRRQRSCRLDDTGAVLVGGMHFVVPTWGCVWYIFTCYMFIIFEYT